MKIQLQHEALSARIRLGIAFICVCVLVGLVAFFAGAHAQVATPSTGASATPSPTAFPTFAPRITPHPWGENWRVGTPRRDRPRSRAAGVPSASL